MRQVDDSHNFNHRRRLVGKSKEQFREPATEPFLQQQPFAPDNRRRLEDKSSNCKGLGDKCRKSLEEPSKVLKQQPLALKNSNKTTLPVCPTTFANAVGKNGWHAEIHMSS